MVADIEEFNGFVCYSCEEHIAGEDVSSPLYECGNCGTQFTRDTSANDNHQCPDCNKFGSKVADQGCPECNEGELTEFEGWFCADCETYFEEKPTDHDCEREAQVERDKSTARMNEQVNKVDVVEASEIEKGDEIFVPDEAGQTVEEYFSTDRFRLALPVYKVNFEGEEKDGVGVVDKVVFAMGGMSWVLDYKYPVFRMKKEHKRFNDAEVT